MAWNLLDISVLRRIELFEQVGDDALIEILSVASTTRYHKGEMIFGEGDPGKALFFILEGTVRISKNIHDVGEEALAILPAGSSFGEMALLDPKARRSANAIADSHVHLGSIDRDDFQKIIDDDLQLAKEFLSSFVVILTKRLRNSNEKIAFFAMNDLYE